MKRDLTVILLCFVAAAGGANVQPILTGAGKLVFPENAVSAYLQASSGALTVAAGGTNTNITLKPSGTGSVHTPGSIFVTGQQNPSPTIAAVRLGYNGTTGVGDIAAFDWVGSTWKSLNLRGGPLLLNYSGGGNVCVNQSTCTYQFDVSGDINASGVYRKGGTAGVGTGSTVTVCTGSTCTGTQTCTLIFNGGIRTGGTCP